MSQLDENALLKTRGTASRLRLNGYPSFEVLANFIPQLVWMCTPDGSNVYFNQRWVEYTGLTLEESYGTGWNIPFHPNDKQPAWDAWNHATETGEAYHIESRLRADDGSYRWFLMRGEPLKDATGGVVHWFGSCTDINDLKVTKEALRQQAALLDLAHDAIFVRGPKNEVAFWNRGAEELYGWTRREAMGRVTHELLKTRFPKPLSEIYAEVEDHGRWEGELVHTRKDGLEITVASRWAAQRGESGVLAGVLEINSDITQRNRAETALRESEERFRLQVTASSDVVYRMNPDWSEMQQLRGRDFTPDQGSPNIGWLQKYIHPDDQSRVQAAIEEARWTKGIFELEHRVLRADGSLGWTFSRAIPRKGPDGEIVEWLGAASDITERKRAEQALRDSEEQFRVLTQNLQSAVAMLDECGAYIVVNSAFLRMFEIPQDADILNVNSRDWSQWRVFDERGVPLVVDEHPVHRAARTRIAVKDQLVILEPPSGSALKWVLIGAEPILDAQGKLHRLICTYYDITGQKRAEERLRQAQKLESLGLLAGGVAHDFNNLLVVVVGNASMALDLLPPGHPAFDLLNGVLKSSEQAAHLTRQMLAYAGKGRFLVEALDLSVVIPEMAGLVGSSIAKKIRLHYDLAEGLPAVLADRGQVQQVFMNLVLNAADAIGTQDGLITVRTGVEEVDQHYMQLHPEMAALAAGRYLYLEVRDTGSGIDEATKAKIFDPFFTTKFIGRGLGLAAVDGIMRGHKGGIVVTSAPGKGSCFTALFPAAANAGKKCPPPEAANPPFQGTGVVLVVDDEQPVREMLKRALETLGYTVLVADGGLAAIDVANRHPGEIALVVLDLSMPHMSGQEVLRELRKLRPDVKVLITSGYSESEALSLFNGQHVSGFIQKPYTLKGLAETVKTSLERP